MNKILIIILSLFYASLSDASQAPLNSEVDFSLKMLEALTAYIKDKTPANLSHMQNVIKDIARIPEGKIHLLKEQINWDNKQRKGTYADYIITEQQNDDLLLTLVQACGFDVLKTNFDNKGPPLASAYPYWFPQTINYLIEDNPNELDALKNSAGQGIIGKIATEKDKWFDQLVQVFGAERILQEIPQDDYTTPNLTAHMLQVFATQNKEQFLKFLQDSGFFQGFVSLGRQHIIKVLWSIYKEEILKINDKKGTPYWFRISALETLDYLKEQLGDQKFKEQLHYTDSNGQTFIKYAFTKDSADTLQSIIELVPDEVKKALDTPNPSGELPLFEELPSVEVLNVLLENPPFKEIVYKQRDAEGRNLAHKAALAENMKIVEKLYKSKPETIYEEDENGLSAVFHLPAEILIELAGDDLTFFTKERGTKKRSILGYFKESLSKDESSRTQEDEKTLERLGDLFRICPDILLYPDVFPLKIGSPLWDYLEKEMLHEPYSLGIEEDTPLLDPLVFITAYRKTTDPLYNGFWHQKGWKTQQTQAREAWISFLKVRQAYYLSIPKCTEKFPRKQVPAVQALESILFGREIAKEIFKKNENNNFIDQPLKTLGGAIISNGGVFGMNFTRHANKDEIDIMKETLKGTSEQAKHIIVAEIEDKKRDIVTAEKILRLYAKNTFEEKPETEDWDDEQRGQYFWKELKTHQPIQDILAKGEEIIKDEKSSREKISQILQSWIQNSKDLDDFDKAIEKTKEDVEEEEAKPEGKEVFSRTLDLLKTWLYDVEDPINMEEKYRKQFTDHKENAFIFAAMSPGLNVQIADDEILDMVASRINFKGAIVKQRYDELEALGE